MNTQRNLGRGPGQRYALDVVGAMAQLSEVMPVILIVRGIKAPRDHQLFLRVRVK